MPKGRILLADNHQDFLETCADKLIAAGYSVLKADSPAAAQRILTEEWVHLAVLDLRLDDDSDERDKSGLVLARMVAPSVPKIILTAYPSIDDVRGALLPSTDGSASAVDFVQKSPTLKPLLEAINRAFILNVRIRQELTFEFGELGGTFLSLTNAIEGSTGELLLNRASEIEDLFRRLFYDYEHIKIDRLLWRHNKRSALTAFAFSEGKSPESFVVVFGPRARQIEELRSYRELAPKTPSEISTFLRLASDTTHFAANAYNLVGADLESVLPLSELYRAAPEKVFNVSLNTLFKKVLAAWHEGVQGNTSDQTLAEFYRRKMGPLLMNLTPQAFEERVTVLTCLTPVLGLKISRSDGEFNLNFDGQSFSYADPSPILFGEPSPEHRFILVNSPGFISGSNIITDAGGRVWLTDFADAGISPLLWHHVSLESTIRFDWASARQLHWLHHMESYLVDGEFGRLYVGDFEQPLRQMLRAIQSVRRLVPRAAHKDPTPYHLGVLFQAASRFAAFDSNSRPTLGVLAKTVHLLLAILIICTRLSRSLAASPDAKPAHAGIHLDEAERAVWVNGVRVRLRGHGYELLLDFFKHPEHLRTRRELVEQVFNEKYHETDASQVSRLNTAIHRLRKQLEENPKQPRYLLTDEGGYRLILNPSS